MRHIIPFNDNRRFAKPCETAQAVALPHTWNADGQDGGNDYWRGTARYPFVYLLGQDAFSPPPWYNPTRREQTHPFCGNTSRERRISWS